MSPGFRLSGAFWTTRVLSDKMSSHSDNISGLNFYKDYKLKVFQVMMLCASNDSASSKWLLHCGTAGQGQSTEKVSVLHQRKSCIRITMTFQRCSFSYSD